MTDIWMMEDGTVWENVHPKERCLGERCVVHAPTDHHMRNWAMRLSSVSGIVYRMCPHGNPHVDPDSRYYLVAVRGFHVPSCHCPCGCCGDGCRTV